MKEKFFNLRIFIPVIIIGLILSSCSKDSTPSPTDNLIGTWTTSSATFTATIDGKTMTQYFIDMGLSAAQAQQYTALFNATVQQSFTGTITMKSDNTYTSDMGGETDTGTWSLSSDGKMLTIDPSTDVPMIADVVELTSSTLHLQGNETETDDLNDDGTDETIIVTVDLTFTK
jgi:hypothetical protein